MTETCYHVIDGASKVTVTLKSGKEYKATIVGGDSENDIAVIKINATGLTAATYGDSSSLSVGSEVVAIGNPLGTLGGTATTGILSATDRELTVEGKTLNLLQTDASINPGNSGGGLFDAYGNLIGIVESKSTGSDVEGLGFALPVNKVAKVAKTIIEGGHIDGEAVIGVSVTELTKDEAQQYGFSKAGIYVAEVTTTNAQNAGLKVGDMAAASVLNGFGKSAGLVQISELGTIETPIILTNTFSVGTALNALTKYMLVDNTDIGVTTGTVNCVVAECNDGRLNDIRGMHGIGCCNHHRCRPHQSHNRYFNRKLGCVRKNGTCQDHGFILLLVVVEGCLVPLTYEELLGQVLLGVYQDLLVSP